MCSVPSARRSYGDASDKQIIRIGRFTVPADGGSGAFDDEDNLAE
jgi:hypothetical protein